MDTGKGGEDGGVEWRDIGVVALYPTHRFGCCCVHEVLGGVEIVMSVCVVEVLDLCF